MTAKRGSWDLFAEAGKGLEEALARTAKTFAGSGGRGARRAVAGEGRLAGAAGCRELRRGCGAAAGVGGVASCRGRGEGAPPAVARRFVVAGGSRLYADTIAAIVGEMRRASPVDGFGARKQSTGAESEGIVLTRSPVT